MARYIFVRLRPGDDLRKKIESVAAESGLQSGFIASIVGSLSAAELRMAGGLQAMTFEGPLEIIAGTGTVASDGIHVHVCLSRADGSTVGGHLLPGCIVATTTELGIGDVSDKWQFTREHDPETGSREFVPRAL